jgi:hypothetical protein
MYESVRPFLQSLQTLDPSRYPMSRYLIGGKQDTRVRPPEYSLKPGFKWNLGSLLSDRARAEGGQCVMNPNDGAIVQRARKDLKENGKLDAR